MLRGDEQHFHPHEETPASEPSRQAAKSQALFFAELRRAAARHGIAVQPPGSRLAGNGEMLLLTWLAQEQRITSHGRAIPADPLLIAAVARCAGLLDALHPSRPEHPLRRASARETGAHGA